MWKIITDFLAPVEKSTAVAAEGRAPAVDDYIIAVIVQNQGFIICFIDNMFPPVLPAFAVLG